MRAFFMPALSHDIGGNLTVFIVLGKAVTAAIAAAAINAGPRAQDPVQTDPPAQTTPAPQSKNFFNPQISLVTDFRWNAINSDPTVRKRGFLKEAELGLASDIDPFLRGEAYIAFADENGESVAEVEEAFARYSNLGRGVSAKFGKIAAAIGRVQRNHADQLNWLDFPFMVQDMLGEEGLRAGGASLSYLLPGDRFHEFTIEALDAPNEALFARAHAGSPVFVGAYRTFFDFNQDSSAQVGLSYANGASNVGTNRSQLFAAEFTYKWQPGTPGKSLNFETEGYWAKPGGSSDTKFGAFSALTYELRPRLFTYAKVDYSEVPNSTDIRRGLTLGATLKVTEFHHWRVEWQSINSNFAPNQNVLNIQFQWIIGAHPAHKY
jgi:hypothetical protein